MKRYLLIIILIVLGSAAAVYDVVLRMENERVQNMSEHLLERVFIRGLRDYYGMLTDARTVMENCGSAETLQALQGSTDMGSYMTFAYRPQEVLQPGDWHVRLTLDDLVASVTVHQAEKFHPLDHKPAVVLDLMLSEAQPDGLSVRIYAVRWLQHITEDLGLGNMPLQIRWQGHMMTADVTEPREMMLVFSDFMIPQFSLYLSYARIDGLFNQKLTALVLALLVAIPEFVLLFWLWRQHFYSYRLRRALDKSRKDLLDEQHVSEARSRLLHNTSAQVEHLNQSLEEARRRMELSERLAALGEISAGIAHEINNPVAYCRSNLETLREDLDALQAFIRRVDQMSDSLAKDSDFYHELAESYQPMALPEALASLPERIDDLSEGIDRIARIVSDMRKLSRRSTDVMEPSLLNEQLDSVINMARSRIKGNIRLEVRLQELPLIPCNPSQIGQVVLNILVNAIQALAAKKDDGVITLKETLSSGWLAIEIRDNGPGMDKEVASRVFEPFFTTKGEGEGTGMGLALCYQLIEAHHGRIELETQPGEGTCFTIWLPLDAKRLQE